MMRKTNRILSSAGSTKASQNGNTASAFPVGIELEGFPNRCRLGEFGEIDSPGS